MKNKNEKKLKTEEPVSEKDEVKQAEKKTQRLDRGSKVKTGHKSKKPG